MKKVDKFNEMIILGQAKTKQGDGISDVLTLMQDLREFSKKLQSCVEAQTDQGLKNRINALSVPLERMYADLSQVVSSAKLIQVTQEQAEESVTPAITKANSFFFMDANSIRKLS